MDGEAHLGLPRREKRHRSDKLAYFGFSAGAWRGPVFRAVDSRFRASILLAGGLYWRALEPEAEPVNFAPRSTVPTLLLGGRDDFVLPMQKSQVPLFQLLGTRVEDKRHVVMDGGHVPDRWDTVVGEVLRWLDRYLGPLPRCHPAARDAAARHAQSSRREGDPRLGEARWRLALDDLTVHPPVEPLVPGDPVPDDDEPLRRDPVVPLPPVTPLAHGR